MLTSLPNLLSLSRIGVIPVLLVLFFIEGDQMRWAACALFAVAGLTDYLDGYLARVRKQVSPLGRFLDPVADKLLVASVLLMLATFDRISGPTLLPAVVILCREIMVSGLREHLAELRVGMPASRMAKLKTTIQMVAIGILIVGDSGPAVLPVTLVGEIGLWLAAMLTLVTGYDYMRAGLAHMTGGAPDGVAAPGRDDRLAVRRVGTGGKPAGAG